VVRDRSFFDGNAMRYVLPVLWMTSCFYYNRANGPESETTHMVRPVRQMATAGAKSVVVDCILFLFQVNGLILCLRMYEYFANFCEQ